MVYSSSILLVDVFHMMLIGFGKLSFADGSYYHGEFVNNEIIGQGTRYFALKRNTYTGHFYYGKMRKFVKRNINHFHFTRRNAWTRMFEVRQTTSTKIFIYSHFQQ
jgi:hypothetical protein